MENVGKAFFFIKKLIFKNFYFLKFLGCVRDQKQVTKTMVYSKLESPKGWSSAIYNALAITWIVESTTLHKSYTESIKVLCFGINFHKWLFVKLEFSNYQLLIKAYINTPYKRNRIFWGRFQYYLEKFLLSPSKKYGNCMITIFFQEKET